MKRREFHQAAIGLGTAGLASFLGSTSRGEEAPPQEGDWYMEPPKKLPVRRFDVVIAGGGTAGVVAALAAAAQGVKTALIEAKGYTGGTVTEGGTALHSFYNLWKAFPGVEKRQVIRGFPQKIIDRLLSLGACSGHAEMEKGFNYDSVCTAIDTEMYKLVTMEMLAEAGVEMFLNTMVVGAIRDGNRLLGAVTESRAGREAFFAHSFVDCTAYGDLAAFAGADFTEPNDYAVANSIGLANVNVEKYYEFLESHDALTELARGLRSGQDGQIVRLEGRLVNLPEDFRREATEIGMSTVTTTVHDNYFMFIKLNLKLPVSPTNRDAVTWAELELRRRQARAVELFRKYVPGCEKAFIARTAPRLNIRRARCIRCDYDVTREDVLEGRHFPDEVFVYGFHDMAPRYQIKDGGTYGMPYRALCVSGLDNLWCAGMLITSDYVAHMSTRNTVCSMAQGQAAGTAAALCAQQKLTMRDLPYKLLRQTLEKDDVVFES
ncbi:MAG TPA: FAD-dependent oxidoreductase [Thermogutta sp.]|nr:FAD-dependent oxidoreductase [Thermogutta sp.]